MLGMTVATMATKSKFQQRATVAGSSLQAPSPSSAASPGGMPQQGSQVKGKSGLTLDYATFFELFAQSPVPIHSVEECLSEWYAKLLNLHRVTRSDTTSGQVNTAQKTLTAMDSPVAEEQVVQLHAHRRQPAQSNVRRRESQPPRQ